MPSLRKMTARNAADQYDCVLAFKSYKPTDNLMQVPMSSAGSLCSHWAELSWAERGGVRSVSITECPRCCESLATILLKMIMVMVRPKDVPIWPCSEYLARKHENYELGSWSEIRHLVQRKHELLTQINMWNSSCNANEHQSRVAVLFQQGKTVLYN